MGKLNRFIIELLAHNIISPTEHRIKLLTMEILSQSCTIQSSSSQSKQQADEVVFLYRVVPGSRACNSYGAWCASIAGIPTPIVQRGKSPPKKKDSSNVCIYLCIYIFHT